MPKIIICIRKRKESCAESQKASNLVLFNLHKCIVILAYRPFRRSAFVRPVKILSLKRFVTFFS